MARGFFPRISLAIVVLLFTSMVFGSQPVQIQSTEEALIQLERNWDAAFSRKDVAFIANVVAEEFVGTYDDGARGDKAQELENAATFDKRIDSVVLDEFIVKNYGNTAVVWFTKHMTGPIKGRPTTLSNRFEIGRAHV